MREAELFEKIKMDLPNFPEEVVRLWLLPFAEDIGWPPTPLSEWNGKLENKNLDFWKESSWEKTSVNLDEVVFSFWQIQANKGMYAAFVLNQNNAYSQTLGEKSKIHFNKILREMLQTGIFKEPAIFFEAEPGKFNITDGNHKYLAYVRCCEIWNSIKHLSNLEKAQQASKYSVPNIVRPSRHQEVWICNNLSNQG